MISKTITYLRNEIIDVILGKLSITCYLHRIVFFFLFIHKFKNYFNLSSQIIKEKGKMLMERKVKLVVHTKVKVIFEIQVLS